eukprot:GHRR01012573.1.p1 GENE.GHRR01012573.1~~GHRR01012573.1.p1  ORF type:complete len:108 (-),score=20.02 GHRR01012573.1:292-615(-)
MVQRDSRAQKMAHIVPTVTPALCNALGHVSITWPIWDAATDSSASGTVWPSVSTRLINLPFDSPGAFLKEGGKSSVTRSSTAAVKQDTTVNGRLKQIGVQWHMLTTC